MNALKIALFSAAAIAFTAPAFAQTADTSKPAVSAPSTTEAAKPAAKSDTKTETKADASTSGAKNATAAHKGKKHHKHASARPAKSTAPVAGKTKSSS